MEDLDPVQPRMRARDYTGKRPQVSLPMFPLGPQQLEKQLEQSLHRRTCLEVRLCDYLRAPK